MCTGDGALRGQTGSSEAMRLRGKTALEHANYLLTEVERSLKSEGAAQSLDGASTERGFRRPAPLAPIRPDTAER